MNIGKILLTAVIIAAILYIIARMVDGFRNPTTDNFSPTLGDRFTEVIFSGVEAVAQVGLVGLLAAAIISLVNFAVRLFS